MRSGLHETLNHVAERAASGIVARGRLEPPGLIRTLPETEKYMRKVPATRRRLDSVIAGAALGENGVRTLR